MIDSLPPGSSASRKAGRARSSSSSSSFTAIRTAWKSRAKSGGPDSGPSTARMALTRSSLVLKRGAAGAARSRPPDAGPAARRRSPGRSARGSAAPASFSRIGRGRRQRAHPHVERRARTESKTAASSSSWREETPRSRRMKSGSKPSHRLERLGGAVRGLEILDAARRPDGCG